MYLSKAYIEIKVNNSNTYEKPKTNNIKIITTLVVIPLRINHPKTGIKASNKTPKFLNNSLKVKIKPHFMIVVIFMIYKLLRLSMYIKLINKETNTKFAAY